MVKPTATSSLNAIVWRLEKFDYFLTDVISMKPFVSASPTASILVTTGKNITAMLVPGYINNIKDESKDKWSEFHNNTVKGLGRIIDVPSQLYQEN